MIIRIQKYVFSIAICTFASASTAQNLDYGHDDALGQTLGCKTIYGFLPLCPDGPINDLFIEQRFLREQISLLPEISLTEEMGLGRIGTSPTWVELPGAENQVQLMVNQCRGDKECQVEAMTSAVILLRKYAGLDPNMISITTEQLADAESARELGSASAGSLKAADEATAQAIEEEYTREWQAARTALAPADDPGGVDPLFAWRYPEPDRWIRKRREECAEDLGCLAERPDLLDSLIDHRIEAVGLSEEKNRLARAAAEEEERQQESVRRAHEEQVARLEQEQRELANTRAAMASVDLDSLLPEGSKLRYLLVDGFETFDSRVAMPMAKNEAAGHAAAANFFGAGGISGAIETGVIWNRKNLVAAAYAISRRHAVGFCDDHTVEVYRGTTPDMETRTLSGIVISRSPGVDRYVKVSRQFAAFVEKSNYDRWENRFTEEIKRLGGCDSLILKHLDQNIINFATEGRFIPWG